MLLLGALLMLAGGACMAGYALIGSEIDSEGFLKEPFALILLGYLAIALGFLTFALAGAVAFSRGLRRNQ